MFNKVRETFFLTRLALALACLLPFGGCTADSIVRRVERRDYSESQVAGAVFSRTASGAEWRREEPYRERDEYRRARDRHDDDFDDDYDDDDDDWYDEDYPDDDQDDIDDRYDREFRRRPASFERPLSLPHAQQLAAAAKPRRLASAAAEYDDEELLPRRIDAYRPPVRGRHADDADDRDDEPARRRPVAAPLDRYDAAPPARPSEPRSRDRDRAPDPDREPPKRDEPKKPPRKPGLMDDLTMGMMAVRREDFESKPREMPLSLRHVAASVLRNNRSIQVAAYRPEQARAGLDAAKAVYDTELFGSWNHSRAETPAPMIISGVPSRNRDFRNEVGQVGLNQHLPSGGQMRVYREWNSGTERNPGSATDRGHGGAYVMELSQPVLNGFGDAENKTLIEISRLQVDITEEELRQTMIENMTKALTAYWEVAQAREEVRISEESLDMATRLLEREFGRWDEGISTQLDVDRAKEAAASRAYNLMLAKEQQRTAQENLKYLINDRNIPLDMDIFVRATESLESPLVRVNLDKAIDTALKRRPEMTNADLAIRTSEARRQFAKHSILPQLNVVGQLRRNDKDNTTPSTGSSTLYTGTDWTLGLEFAMPIGNQKARANLRQAESEVSQKVEEKKDARDYIISEVKTVVKNMELVVREIPLNRRAMESARKVLEGEWAKLELNQTGNRDLLQAQDLVSVTERNFVTSQVRYNVHIINLFAAQGTLLDKMGIRLR